MGQTEPHFLSDPMSDRKKKFSPTLPNIYKKTAWCMTLHGENAVHFLCTPKNEGKRVHVPPDEKTCGHAGYILTLLILTFGRNFFHTLLLFQYCHWNFL